MIEEWRDVSGYEGLYQVSNLGRVKSLPRERIYPTGKVYRRPEVLLKPAISKNGGYPIVNLITPGIYQGRTCPVHVLVATAFHEKPDDGVYREVRHLDGNSLNSRFDNLAWGTRVENQADRILHGRTNRGERCGTSKLTQRQVDAIRVLLEDTLMSQEEIAKWFGISEATVSGIKHNKKWAHSPC